LEKKLKWQIRIEGKRQAKCNPSSVIPLSDKERKDLLQQKKHLNHQEGKRRVQEEEHYKDLFTCRRRGLKESKRRGGISFIGKEGVSVHLIKWETGKKKNERLCPFVLERKEGQQNLT